MKKVAVSTDSNSAITPAEGKRLGVYVLPMPFMLGGEIYFEGISLSQEMFYKRLQEDLEISTSQPSAGAVLEMWDRLLKEHDEVVHIPMSSGLSASYDTAAALSVDYGGRVAVVNNRRISVTLRRSVLDALELAASGLDARAIKERLEAASAESSIYIMLNTLKYIKKGGRITPAGAAIGAVLNIKPVLQLQGDKLDSYAKARGARSGRRIMIEAMQNDFNGRFKQFASPEGMWLQAAYTHERETALDFKKELEQAFPGYDIYMAPLPLSVACHIGPGALAVACSRRIC